MYVLLLALALGVVLIAYYVSVTTVLFVSSALGISLVMYGFFLRIRGRNTHLVGVFLFAVLLVALGAVRMHMVLDVSHSQIESLNNTYQTLEGQVVLLPEDRETTTRVILGDVVISGERVDSDILVWIPKTEEVRIKDTVEVAGVLRKPESFETDTGRVFDYTNYLAKDDVYLEMLDPQRVSITSYEGLSLLRMLESIKHFFLHRLESVLPEPHSSLGGGILLGEKQSLGDLWQDRFRVVGLVHIVVLSGYNIAIVVGLILFLLSGLSLVWSSVFSVVGIVLFALLVGGGATVVRASLMASFLVVARYFHRPYDALRGLFLAGGVMILINPRILIHDLSFQLSFLATLGIILYTPILEKWCSRIPTRFALREIIVTTLSAQIFVLPWIAYTIGDFSIVSFVANVLVLPIVPPAMFFSFVAGVLPLIPVAVPAYALLHYILSIAEFLAAIPYASVVVPQVPFVVVMVVYVMLVVFPFVVRRKK